MSLGWQGESALLPKKSKPISVDGKSMIRLKAAIFDEQEKLTFRNQNKSQRIRSQRGNNNNNNNNKDNNNLFIGQNKGINERNKRDEDNQNKSNDIIKMSLIAKAKVYDQLAQSKTLEGSELLVNFKEKENNLHEDQNDYSDLEDEFGRIKRVRRDSTEYNSLKQRFIIQTQTQNININQTKDQNQGQNSTQTHQYVINSNSENNRWIWSKGESIDQINYNKEINDTKLLSDMINNSLNQTLLSKNQNQNQPNSQSHSTNQDDYTSKTLISAESRVKSQWEKTLQGQSRNYLDQIHQEIEEKRLSSNIDNDSAINHIQSVAEERRMLLKRKQLERQKLKDESSTS